MEPFGGFKWSRPADELGTWIDGMGVADAAVGRWLPGHVGLYDEGQDRAEFHAAAAVEWAYHAGARYEPLTEDPALFLKFAGLDDHETAIAAFSAAYGRLTHCESILPVTIIGLPRGLVVETAEHIDTWRDHLGLMKTGVALWDALRAKDARTIRRLLHYSESDRRGTFTLTAPCRRLEVGEILGDDGQLLFWMQSPIEGPTNEEDAALGALRALVTAVLRTSSSPALDIRSDSKRLDLVVRPYDLAGAMWLQFALAISGNRSYKACECCGTWFEKSPMVSRSDREYCGPSCRAKAWRDRKKSAAGEDT